MGYLGIDTGQSGALGYVSKGTARSVPLPLDLIEGKKKYNFKRLKILLVDFKNEGVDKVILERTFPTPFLHGGASWNLGYGFGIMQTMINMLFPAEDLEIVDAKAWQKVMFAGHTRRERMFGGKTPRKGKESTKDLAARVIDGIFPQGDWFEDVRGKRRVHDGRVDALLIAEYGRRMDVGEIQQ